MPAAGTFAKLGVLVPVKAGALAHVAVAATQHRCECHLGRAHGASKIVGLGWDSVMQVTTITLLLSGRLELSSRLLSC